MEEKQKRGGYECHEMSDLSAAWQMVEIVDRNIADQVFFFYLKVTSWKLLIRKAFYKLDVNILEWNLRTFYNCF